MHPKISVIIPCFNLGTYLDACLNSISIQSQGEIEYVFINDGSSDDTLGKLERFILYKPSCKLINQENGGVSIARNAGLAMCTGEYIYLLDGDDVLTDSAIDQMLTDISSDNPDLIISNVKRVRGSKVIDVPLTFKIGIYSPVELYESIEYFHPAPQLLYRRAIIEDQRLRFNTRLSLGEVYDFTVRFLAFAKKIKVVDSCYFLYTVRPTSATQQPNYNKDITIVESIKEYNRFGGILKEMPSFKLTNFKMLLGFTYNKYLKQQLHTSDAYSAISTFLSDSDVKNCIRAVKRCKGISIKNRMFAEYISVTGIWGYRIINKILSIR